MYSTAWKVHWKQFEDGEIITEVEEITFLVSCFDVFKSFFAASLNQEVKKMKNEDFQTAKHFFLSVAKKEGFHNQTAVFERVGEIVREKGFFKKQVLFSNKLAIHLAEVICNITKKYW